jgi:hypothetical protein
MAKQTYAPLTLPVSGAQIKFTEDYNPGKMADFTRQLLQDEALIQKMQTDPLGQLKKIGVVISKADEKKITNDDLLAAMGMKGTVEATALSKEQQPLAALPIVIVIVVVYTLADPPVVY